ncbi:MAG: transglycosylase SLT domain-containing protein, partial [Undibacterium sp.]|nr:transglycosylase SLT domain-containing protein [Undibacterium sp.]
MPQIFTSSARSHYHSSSAQKEITRLLANSVNSSNQVSSTIGQAFGALSSVLHLTSAFGLAAIVLLICLFVNPNLGKQFIALSPFASDNQAQVSLEDKVLAPNLAMLMATPVQVSQANTNEVDAKKEAEASTNYHLIGNQKQQHLVTNWLSKRYRVANDAIDMLVSAAYLTAKDTKLDPLLILSVIAIESRFNPFSESPVGAQGLMQVMAKVHQDKFSDLGGVKAALNPVANIKVGAMILKEYVRSTGSIEAGLKRYVGASENETDGGYGNLV